LLRVSGESFLPFSGDIIIGSKLPPSFNFWTNTSASSRELQFPIRTRCQVFPFGKETVASEGEYPFFFNDSTIPSA
jgi:hypothetical protein